MYTNNKVLLILAVIYTLTVFVFGLNENVETAEVDYGKSVVLHCKSNDDLHNFKFWHLSTAGVVIGPTNSFNINKFKYEILSGNLTIKVSHSYMTQRSVVGIKHSTKSYFKWRAFLKHLLKFNIFTAQILKY